MENNVLLGNEYFVPIRVDRSGWYPVYYFMSLIVRHPYGLGLRKSSMAFEHLVKLAPLEFWKEHFPAKSWGKFDIQDAHRALIDLCEKNELGKNGANAFPFPQE